MTQIDPTKRYQTRDGRPVRILCVDAPGVYPVVGYISLDKGAFPVSWTTDGRCIDELPPSGDDLVEIPENRRLAGWVNVYQNGSHGYWPTKALADSTAKWSHPRIACVDLSRFEYTVGEGLE